MRPRKVSREKVLQIRGRRPRICNVFEKICNVLEKIKITLEQIFLTVGQNNYGNKIPLQPEIASISSIKGFFHFERPQ